jgi:hypothetical protein
MQRQDVGMECQHLTMTAGCRPPSRLECHSLPRPGFVRSAGCETQTLALALDGLIPNMEVRPASVLRSMKMQENTVTKHVTHTVTKHDRYTVTKHDRHTWQVASHIMSVQPNEMTKPTRHEARRDTTVDQSIHIAFQHPHLNHQ